MASFEVQHNAPLKAFISEISQGPARFPDSEEAVRIRQDVITISQGLVESLVNSGKRSFKNARLIPAGSTQDGLKIGAPDEFDFMIELPAIDESVMMFKRNEKYVERATSCIRDLEFYRDLFCKERKQSCNDLSTKELDSALCSYVLSNKAKMEETVTRGILETIHKVVDDYFEHVDLPGWSVNPGYYKNYENDLGAITAHFIWFGKEYPKLGVNVDYVIAVPYNNIVDYMQQIPMHYILRLGSVCKLSCVIQEQEYLSQFAIDSPEKTVIRVTKYILGNYLPKYYSGKNQDMQSSVTSYIIKNVAFHQFQDLPKSEWTMDNIAVLVFELIKAIKKRIDELDVKCYHMPDYNLLRTFKEMFLVPETPGLYVNRPSEQKNMSSTQQCLLELCMHFLEISAGNHSAVDEMKATMKQRQRDNLECKQRKLEDYVLTLLFKYMYANENYDNELLLEAQKFIARNNMDTFHLSGHGNSLRLSRNGSPVDLKEVLFRQMKEEEENHMNPYALDMGLLCRQWYENVGRETLRKRDEKINQKECCSKQAPLLEAIEEGPAKEIENAD